VTHSIQEVGVVIAMQTEAGRVAQAQEPQLIVIVAIIMVQLIHMERLHGELFNKNDGLNYGKQ
jgi:hypothetical protein